MISQRSVSVTNIQPDTGRCDHRLNTRVSDNISEESLSSFLYSRSLH